MEKERTLSSHRGGLRVGVSIGGEFSEEREFSGMVGSLQLGAQGGQRIPLAEGILEEDEDPDLETRLGMQSCPKDLVCQSLFTLAAPTTNTACSGDQATMGSHPQIGRAHV